MPDTRRQQDAARAKAVLEELNTRGGGIPGAISQYRLDRYGQQADLAYQRRYGTSAAADRLSADPTIRTRAITYQNVYTNTKLDTAAGSESSPRGASTQGSRKTSNSPTKKVPSDAFLEAFKDGIPGDTQSTKSISRLQEDTGGQTRLTQKNEGEGVSSFNISNFRANAVNKDSVLPKHSFLVTFAPFAASQKAAAGLNKYILGAAGGNLIMRCDSAQLPGVTTLKEEVRRFGYGPVEDSVYGVQFQDMTLSFILDQDASQAKFFDEWMKHVTNFASKGGGNMLVKNDKNMLPYEVGYKDDYSNLQMNITVFDRSHRKVIVYEIYDVFPIAINTTDVSWGDTDQLLRYYVRFAFTDYTMKVPDAEYALYEASAIDRARTFSQNEETSIVVSTKAIQGAMNNVGGKSVFGTSFDADPAKTYISSDPTNKTSVVDKYLPTNSLLRTENLNKALYGEPPKKITI